jgi:hypothetical protein
MLRDPDWTLLSVEAGADAEDRLRKRGQEPTPAAEAAPRADAVVLAVPDIHIKNVASRVAPLMKSGAMLICLDPAAPHGGELPDRPDISCFITHPCHPPVINDETAPEARLDFFGGKAKQNIVCALMRGPESDYAKGEALCRKMFAPVMNAHRVTVEQMAILEPAMAETVTLTCMFIIREAMDEAIRRGVPEAAARDFILGHINVNIGILFKYIDAELSDGAKLAVKRAMDRIIQPDWKSVFEPDNVLAEVKAITRGRTAG